MKKVAKKRPPHELPPKEKPTHHVPLGSTVVPWSLLKCTSSQPSSRHVPPPGTSNRQIRLKGWRTLPIAANLRASKFSSGKLDEERKYEEGSASTEEDEDKEVWVDGYICKEECEVKWERKSGSDDNDREWPRSRGYNSKIEWYASYFPSSCGVLLSLNAVAVSETSFASCFGMANVVFWFTYYSQTAKKTKSVVGYYARTGKTMKNKSRPE